MANYITRIGAEVNIAEDMYEVATNIEIGLSERLAAVEDVDAAEALTRFSMLQNQYQINLQLTSKMRGIVSCLNACNNVDGWYYFPSLKRMCA